MRKHTTLISSLALILAVAGCAADDGGSSETYGPPSYSGVGDSDGRGASEGGGMGGPSGGGGVPAGGCGEGCEGIEEVPAGQLTAGEWRDLDDWELWLDLMTGDAWATSSRTGATRRRSACR